MKTVGFQDLLDWGFEGIVPNSEQLDMFERERQRFLTEEWERIHKDDRPFEPDWDVIALQYEQYTDKIVKNGA